MISIIPTDNSIRYCVPPTQYRFSLCQKINNEKCCNSPTLVAGVDSSNIFNELPSNMASSASSSFSTLVTVVVEATLAELAGAILSTNLILTSNALHCSIFFISEPENSRNANQTYRESDTPENISIALKRRRSFDAVPESHVHLWPDIEDFSAPSSGLLTLTLVNVQDLPQNSHLQ